MARRTPPVHATAKVQVEPQRRAYRPPASVEAFRPSLPEIPPRGQDGIGHRLALIASVVVHPLRHRHLPPAVEARWYPHDLAVGSTARRIGEAARLVAPKASADAESLGGLDRRCAVATMIVAAALAVAVSFVVAPRLRNASPTALTESSALVAQGAGIYQANCAGCHGAALQGSDAGSPAPPPLDASGHAWLHSDTTLFRIIKFGAANCQGGAAAPRMPGFGEQLDDRSIRAVIGFVKNRWPRDLRIVQNAFNDGASDGAESQEAVLCTPLCVAGASPAPAPLSASR